MKPFFTELLFECVFLRKLKKPDVQIIRHDLKNSKADKTSFDCLKMHLDQLMLRTQIKAEKGH